VELVLAGQVGRGGGDSERMEGGGGWEDIRPVSQWYGVVEMMLMVVELV
jgi:hypothetical protein